ncbi:cyclin A2 [Reticulomyxa filosa]|uniref:Cyclin A2 n=1 Tax=Reticulomyxa filosa TaxID=46433 RepID=X6NI70_RETFI|nr:cyclin A2 [Reticulomyxa filosa]|eukprot:ETO25696.1 cyclin A2 [Reticulomyxa filosa]
MRSVLIDWFIEIMQKYRLSHETIALAIKYTDRTLSKLRVNRNKLQLVGVTALMLASKVYEISPPMVEEWVYICHDHYDAQKVCAMEALMLNELEFCMLEVTSLDFLSVWMQILSACQQHKTMAYV